MRRISPTLFLQASWEPWKKATSHQQISECFTVWPVCCRLPTRSRSLFVTCQCSELVGCFCAVRLLNGGKKALEYVDFWTLTLLAVVNPSEQNHGFSFLFEARSGFTSCSLFLTIKDVWLQRLQRDYFLLHIYSAGGF